MNFQVFFKLNFILIIQINNGHLQMDFAMKLCYTEEKRKGDESL